MKISKGDKFIDSYSGQIGTVIGITFESPDTFYTLQYTDGKERIYTDDELEGCSVWS